MKISLRIACDWGMTVRTRLVSAAGNGVPFMADETRARFPNLISVRCPPALPVAIERAADRDLTTPSEYVRRALIDRLRADGFDPAESAVNGPDTRMTANG